MPIYKYSEGEHGGGFVGLRVAVLVNKELKQKYFSFIKDGYPVSLDEKKVIEKEAIQLEGNWKYQQKYSANNRNNQANETRHTVYSTGVRGIRMKFISYKKKRGGELRTYYTPMFVVSGSNHNKRFSKNFNIVAQGYQSAWTSAVLYYAIIKELDNPSGLIDRLPPVEKFMIIFKTMHSMGHKIPMQRLPAELWKNNQVKRALVEMA